MQFSPSNIDTRPHSSFVGIHQELCFSPSWLHRASKGYASIGAKELGKAGTAPAHRMVAMLLLGQLFPGDSVLHRCGNRKCHNPYHLYIGGDAENKRDAKLHRTGGQLWGNLYQTCGFGTHIVEMQQPLVLSTETCRRSLKFKGFTPCACFHVNWLAATTDGYPQLHGHQLPADIAGAHRKIHQLFCGPIDRYDIVGHRCGDPTCLNPYHLIIVGRADIGEWNLKYDKRFKLTPADHARIALSTATNAQLAADFGVHPQTIQSYRLSGRNGRQTGRNYSRVRTTT